ncbi:hypothetical protein [Cupriavidus campinensis]|uniref:Uncharacterized protein n=1 Tax=Cupriavidus campinensis TaxID=151783 RepID=A0AAE9HZL4_9BURK|nr:hypothetical protein [Cupriavidus campinensis]URF02830.1 hypothetical protein M5D45_09625 [Cupriavidus campinensis]
MTAHFLAALAVLGMLAAMVWGAYLNYRWMQRQAERSTTMQLVSTATMIERLTRLIDTRELSYQEQVFVRSLKEKVKTGRPTDLAGDEVDMLDEIHGRLFR